LINGKILKGYWKNNNFVGP